MSIMSELISGKIKFREARAKTAAWLTRVSPILTPATRDALEDAVLQGASDAVSLGGTALGAALGPALDGIQANLVAAAGRVIPGPVAAAMVPLANDAIDRIQAAAIAQVQAWSLEAQAAIAAAQAENAARFPQPPVAPAPPARPGV